MTLTQEQEEALLHKVAQQAWKGVTVREDRKYFILNCVNLALNAAYLTLDSLFLSNFLAEFITVLQYFTDYV
jgi:hypothetical protein